MIVITGSDGIVGRALCEALKRRVIPFLPITHRRKAHTLPSALEFDLASTIQPLEKHFGDIQTIVHLAAAVPHSALYPDTDEFANQTRQMDQNILKLQQQTNAHVVYMSTCGLYDRTSTAIKTELAPVVITSPYFAAKADGEELFRTENATILRLAAPIGAGMKANLVLSKFITAARSDNPITIWGSGSRQQNYVDCDDIGSLIIGVVQKPIRCLLNVAANTPCTMLELAQLIVRVAGKGSIKMSPANDPRDGETARYSIEKAMKFFGWSPVVKLEEAIQKIQSDDFAKNV